MKSDGKKGVISLWAEKYLQDTVMTLLPVEENPKCVYYILKIIFSWCILQFETTRVEIDLESVLSFWNRLVLLNQSATQSKTREILICCMAISVKHFVILLQCSNLFDQSGIVKFSTQKELVEVLKCVNYFTCLVKQFSLPSMTVNMRKAAAEAIVASGLLSEASSIASFMSNSHNSSEVVHIEKLETNFEISEGVDFYAGRILDSWFTCLQLLEDEDDGLRRRLADDVQKCIVSKGSNGSHCRDGVPSQVDRVIESSFGFLSAGFGHWIKYLNYLCGYVFAAGSAITSPEDLVRRIFDKEIDNHHEEKLLICQICCSHLEKLSAPHSSENDVEILLKRWRQKFLQQIVSFSNGCLQSEKVADWIGGIGNHKDAFTSVYANLLGLYVLTHNHSLGAVTDDGVNVYLSEFAELRKNMRPFLGNPLISNMYFLVIKAHEEMFGFFADLGHRQECLVWEDFNPYFLIR